MSVLGIKTKAALKRGAEAALSAFVSTLAFAWLDNGGEHTASSFGTSIVDHVDAAGGIAIIALLGTFGYTRSRLPNYSPVAENAPPPDGPLVDVKDDAAVAVAEAEAANPDPPEAA